MREYFPEYYRPSAEELAALWETATIAFDANVLLNLYRYGDGTRDDLFRIIDRLGDRAWLPHQAAREYHENRVEVILEQAAAYDVATKKVEAVDLELTNALGELRKRYPHHARIDVADLAKIAGDAVRDLRDADAAAQAAHPSYLEDDAILGRLTAIFAERVGPPYDDERLRAIHDEARGRWARQEPPGFRDAGKPDDRRYGDVVLWYQLLDRARATKTPVIFVTEDAKDDWWYRPRGQTYGPARGLLREMRMIGVAFHMYAQDRFIEYAKQHLGVDIQNASIAEVRALQRLEAERQRIAPHTGEPAPSEEVDLAELEAARQRVATEDDALTLELILRYWPLIRRTVRAMSRRIDALLQSVEPYRIEGDHLTLVAVYDFHKQKLTETETREALEHALAAVLGKRIGISSVSRSELDSLPVSPPTVLGAAVSTER